MSAVEPDSVEDGRAWYLGILDVIADPTGRDQTVTLRCDRMDQVECTPAQVRAFVQVLLSAADYAEGVTPVEPAPLVESYLDRAFVRSSLKRAAVQEWGRQNSMVSQLDVVASNRRIRALHTVWESMVEPGDLTSVWVYHDGAHPEAHWPTPTRPCRSGHTDCTVDCGWCKGTGVERVRP